MFLIHVSALAWQARATVPPAGAENGFLRPQMQADRSQTSPLPDQRLGEALGRLDAELRLHPDDTRLQQEDRDAAIAYSLQLRNSGRGQESLEYLQRASALQPTDITLLTDIGIQAQALRKFDIAEQALKEALRLAPESAPALYALARVRVDQQHSAEGEALLRRYLQLRPGDASAHYGLGHLLQMQQRTDEANVEFRESIRLQPLQTEAYYQLGQMAAETGRNEEAATLYERTLQRMPHHGGALAGTGALLYREHKYVAARNVLEQAVAAAPDYPPGHYYLGLTLSRLGELAASKNELKRAGELTEQQQGRSAPIGRADGTPVQ